MKKKLLTLTLLLLLAMRLHAQTTEHYTDLNGTEWRFVEVDNDEYSKARIVEVAGQVPNNLVVPTDVITGDEYFGVVEIGDRVFFGRTNLTTLTLPDGLLSIGESAFDTGSQYPSDNISNGVLSLTIPNTVTTIGANAFNGWRNLQILTIPENVASIGYDAFMLCTTLTSVEVKGRGLGTCAFNYCTSLENVKIGANLLTMGSQPFAHCGAINSIVVDEKNPVFDSRNNCNAIIRTADNELLVGCKTTTIPEGIVSIGREAFAQNTGITEVVLPSSVTSIGELAFYGCPKLTAVTVKTPTPVAITEDTFSSRFNATLCVPAGSKAAYEAADYWKEFKEIIETSAIITFADQNVKNLCVANWDTDGDGELSEAEAAAVTDLGEVFKGNTNITSFNELSFFVGLTTIRNKAFSKCSNLANVIIPDNVTNIELQAFVECSNLASITIPSSVTFIGTNAFTACSSLSSINVSNGNTVYDSRNDCNAIIKTSNNTLIRGCQSTIIPNDVTSIYTYAFYGCLGLSSIAIPSNVTSIGSRAFMNCSDLTSVSIPSSVTSIMNNAFDGCSSLISVMVENTTPIAITENAFSNRANATLYVPAGSKAAYEAADYWKDFKEIVESSPIITFTDPNVKNLCVANWDTDGDGELSEAEAAAVSQLGTVFKMNTSITTFEELKYFTGIESIPETTFFGCTSLVSIILPETITSIGWRAFSGCKSLEEMTLPQSIESVGIEAFSGCSALWLIVVPGKNLSFGSMCFEGCVSLRKVFTDNLEGWMKIQFAYNGNPLAFAHRLFINDEELTQLVIPNSTEIINSYTFDGCTSIKSVKLHKNVKKVCYAAFNGCSSLEKVIIDDLDSWCSLAWGSGDDPTSPLFYAHHLFLGDQELTEIDFPNGIPTIGDYAFAGFSFLRNVNIPETVQAIANHSFVGCIGLTSIVLPASINMIGDETFMGCFNLMSVTVKNPNPVRIDEYTFSNRTNATLYVPAGSKAAYEAAEYWNEFKEIKEIPDPSLAKCEKPTILYANGELTFGCATEGVEFHWTITNSTDSSGNGSKVSFTPKTTVSVYASKDGYKDSDTATLDINGSGGLKGDVNNNGGIDIGDAVTIVNFLVGKTATLSRKLETGTDGGEPLREKEPQ